MHVLAHSLSPLMPFSRSLFTLCSGASGSGAMKERWRNAIRKAKLCFLRGPYPWVQLAGVWRACD